MKRIIVLMTALLCVAFGFSASPQSEIVFDKTVHNFGSFPETKPVVTCKFVLKNTGDAPLIINQAIASCGCTIPDYTEKPVMPGEKGAINVTYNGSGRYAGKFKKVITVQSNAKTRLVRLYIEGEMTAAPKK